MGHTVSTAIVIYTTGFQVCTAAVFQILAVYRNGNFKMRSQWFCGRFGRTHWMRLESDSIRFRRVLQQVEEILENWEKFRPIRSINSFSTISFLPISSQSTTYTFSKPEEGGSSFVRNVTNNLLHMARWPKKGHHLNMYLLAMSVHSACL